MNVKLTKDEIKTILDLAYDWGFEYNLIADSQKVRELQDKIKKIYENNNE